MLATTSRGNRTGGANLVAGVIYQAQPFPGLTTGADRGRSPDPAVDAQSSFEAWRLTVRAAHVCRPRAPLWRLEASPFQRQAGRRSPGFLLRCASYEPLCSRRRETRYCTAFRARPTRAENSTKFTDTQCDIMPDRASTSGAEALARGPAASAPQGLRKTDPTNYIDTLNIEPIGLRGPLQQAQETSPH